MSNRPVTQQAVTYTLQLGAKGRVVIPATLRKQLDLREGDYLVLKLEPDDSLRLVSLKAQVKKLRGVLKPAVPACSSVEKLIQIRREEARRE